MKIDAPQSWNDVLACECRSCCALADIFRLCVQRAEFLYVHDCRMFGAGFKVADVRKVFREPATQGPDFSDLESAAAYITARQKHCDAFVSSWPLKPAGWKDYLWKREQLA